jgi:hypothetical protein
MSTALRITKEEIKAIKHVVDYCYEEERTHLEELLYDQDIDDSVDYTELTDDDFYIAVKKLELGHFVMSHIWFSLYTLNNLILKSGDNE